MKGFLTKLLSLGLTFVLLFVCLVGCGKDSGEDSGDNGFGGNIVGAEGIKNVIIIIGDGMGLNHVKAGELYEGKDYAFTSWHQTTVNTDSFDGEGRYTLTDSAAGGTAIATGVVTWNGFVGVDPYGDDLPTVMDRAKELGKATAVISTDAVYGATPASFSGHSWSRGNTLEIVSSQIQTSNCDLLCGAIDSVTVGMDTQTLLKENGYTFCSDYENISETLNAEKAYWQFDLSGVDATVGLEDVTSKALEFVEDDEDGFVMMIEQAHVDKYSHDNNFLSAVKSVASLNRTVEAVMEWIGDRTDTAVLITADHETGGLSVGESVEFGDSCTSLLGKEFSFRYSSTGHTKTPVGLFVYGITPDFSTFDFYAKDSIIKNTETGKMIFSLLK